MVQLWQGIFINGFQSFPIDQIIFNRELLVTDNARNISKPMLLLKVFLYSLGVTLNVHE